MMKKTVVAMALAVIASTAFAAGETGFMPFKQWRTDIWNAYDENKDGALTMEEVKSMDRVLGQDFIGFQPFMVDHFAELDANGDGKVDQDELSKMMVAKEWTDKDMVNQFYKDTGFMPHNPANQ
jgi:hypothetical protein